jgi:hypothetical protein
MTSNQRMELTALRAAAHTPRSADNPDGRAAPPRATVQRATANPSRLSWFHTLRTPYTARLSYHTRRMCSASRSPDRTKPLSEKFRQQPGELLLTRLRAPLPLQALPGCHAHRPVRYRRLHVAQAWAVHADTSTLKTASYVVVVPPFTRRHPAPLYCVRFGAPPSSRS